MLKFLERQKLIKQGLACSKQRRRQNPNEFLNSLECGILAKALVLFAFIAGLTLLIFQGDSPAPAKNFFVALLIFVTALAQLWINHPRAIASNSRLLLILLVCFVQLLLIKIPLMLDANGTLQLHYGVFLFPLAFAPLTLSVLMSKNHGLFAAVFGSLWGAVLIDRIDPVFVVTSLISGFTAVYVTQSVRRRSRLIRAGVYVGLATWLLALSFGQIGPIHFDGTTEWRTLGIQSLLAVGTGIFTAMLVGGMLPVWENLFRITTDISWLEMADLNHPLLKRMTIEAPGTYHHSLVVANLAESAAEAVGANPTICRVGSYFHDIGKLVKPEYFTENIPEGRNPHTDLAPTMSSLIIIAHVKEGVDLALKHKLNQTIIDIIQQHHGTSLVSYFYQRALQQQKDAKLGGKIMNIREEDIPEVKPSSFRYPGPRPQTKEAAIISLADTIESASRSLEKPNPQKLEQFINDLFAQRIAEGQLDECDLTLRDLRTIAERFKFTLQSMMHSRVAYPSAAATPDMAESDMGAPPVSAA